MGFSENQAILLSAPVSLNYVLSGQLIHTDNGKPYYYAVIPVLLSSRIADSK